MGEMNDNKYVKTCKLTTYTPAAKLLTCITLFFFVAFFIYGIHQYITYKPSDYELTANATISSITYDDSSNTYSVFVSYEEDGNTYLKEVDWTADMKIGDPYVFVFTIDYPFIFILATWDIGKLVLFLFLGFLFLIFTLLIVRVNVKVMKRRKYILENGIKKFFTIDSFIINPYYRVNDKIAHYIVCYDEFEKEYYRTSESFLDVSLFKVTDTISAFIDKNDKNFFVIDTETYLEKKSFNK